MDGNSNERARRPNMNIHVFFNEGQKILFDRYFFPSLRDDWRVVTHRIDDVERDQNFGTQGFKAIIHQKIHTLVHDILPREAGGQGFLLSDVDIQFFKSCAPIVRQSLKTYDIVFQRENRRTQEVNTGFIAMRPTRDVINFWKIVDSEMLNSLHQPVFLNEQAVANDLLKSGIPLNWGFFPDQIWAWSNHHLFPSLLLLPGICLHHANCTITRDNKTSLELKMEQLDLVNQLVRRPSQYFLFMCHELGRRISTRLTRAISTPVP